jgi:hypothetical protein
MVEVSNTQWIPSKSHPTHTHTHRVILIICFHDRVWASYRSQEDLCRSNEVFALTFAKKKKSSLLPPVQEPIYTQSILTSLHSLARAQLSGECGCRTTKIIVWPFIRKSTKKRWRLQKKTLTDLGNYWLQFGYIKMVVTHKSEKLSCQIEDQGNQQSVLMSHHSITETTGSSLKEYTR